VEWNSIESEDEKVEKPTCKTCAYRGVFYDRDEGVDPPLQVADCQRFPPIHESLQLNKSFFPEINEEDWCGEHPDFPSYIQFQKELKRKVENGISTEDILMMNFMEFCRLHKLMKRISRAGNRLGINTVDQLLEKKRKIFWNAESLEELA
jgi:hypothetical protein